uniref:Uncharacterized protein n=1 Tax=viral metagenome TaxID=1070528 RepID=A0A6C0BZA4_9ZZZZ
MPFILRLLRLFEKFFLFVKKPTFIDVGDFFRFFQKVQKKTQKKRKVAPY